jgi:hypothetical protein
VSKCVQDLFYFTLQLSASSSIQAVSVWTDFLWNKYTILNSYSQKPQEALNLLVTEEHYWAPFYVPLYKFLHNLLNVLVRITIKMVLQKIYHIQFILQLIRDFYKHWTSGGYDSIFLIPLDLQSVPVHSANYVKDVYSCM